MTVLFGLWMTILFCHPEGFFCHPEGSLFCHPEGAERPKDPFERSENISLPPRGRWRDTARWRDGRSSG